MYKVLFLVHLEENFRDEFPRSLMQNFRKVASNYDAVVTLHSGLSSLVLKNYTTWKWGWGYEEMTFLKDPDEKKWVINAGDHYTWVPRELRDNLEFYKNNLVVIGGGNDGECLLDWEKVLEYMQVPFKKDNRITFP